MSNPAYGGPPPEIREHWAERQARERDERQQSDMRILADVRALWEARAAGYDFGQPYPVNDDLWRIESNDQPVLFWEGSTPEAACHEAAQWFRAHP